MAVKLQLTNGVYLMLAKRRWDSHKSGSIMNRSSRAREDEDNKWLVDGNVADGDYIFVTSIHGETYVAPQSGNGASAHFTLAGQAMWVSYAGEVNFRNGMVRSWNNRSGTYRPPASLCDTAPFPEDKFSNWS